MMTSYRDFSEDLQVETLSRLPVRSLMRFRCVCKSWYSLVNDRNFIYKHLNTDDNMRLMVRITYENYDITDPFNDLITCFFLLPDKSLKDLHFQDLEPETKENPLGPCDGMFCFLEDSNINLWNVSMNEYRVISERRARLPSNTTVYCSNFGLGLDPMTNDFKLVLIHTLYDGKTLSVHDFSPVAVYNFSTNSWRDVEGLFQMGRHYYGSNSIDNVYLNGFCYWVAPGANSCNAIVLSFSMSDEVFQEINGPNIPQLTTSNELEMTYWTIGVYDGCLSLLYSEELGHSFGLWIMKDGSWTKYLNFGPFIETYQPLGFWRKGEFFLESSDNRLILYDSRYEEMRDLGITGLWFSVNVLKESLIAVHKEDI